MPKMSLRASMSLQGRLKLAHLFEMPEAELAELARKLESHPLFARLRSAGAVRLTPFPKAYFTARRFAGWGLRTESAGLPELVDGNCDFVALMRKIGQKRFEDCFLKEGGLSDPERARRCRVTVAEAQKLRRFLDRAFLQGEFERPAAAPATVFSSVAGIGVAEGQAVISFFNREIWKGRYQVDESRLAGLPPEQAERCRAFLKRLQFIDQRKTTLYRLLEALVEGQAEYLRSGEPERRQPLTQRAVAVALGVEPSTINRLVSNKSVQLPWGLEAPMKALMPSAKAVALDRLDALARARPELSDEDLRRELARKHHIFLSRRSITQYRHDLALARRGRRRPA
ncbi:MAG: hypothetical protein NTY77_16500 [Elusimicrobia bacterium]|nr:hypothetical protein [Elusimicrobiota bacterium]